MPDYRSDYASLLDTAVKELERIVRRRKEELYKKRFDLPPDAIVTRFMFARKIKGNIYFYFQYRKDGKQVSYYLGKKDSYKVKLAKKIDKEVKTYRKELFSAFIKDLEFLKEVKK